jgi:hypothetical protein
MNRYVCRLSDEDSKKDMSSSKDDFYYDAWSSSVDSVQWFGGIRDVLLNFSGYFMV